jgi:hypothetical protein
MKTLLAGYYFRTQAEGGAAWVLKKWAIKRFYLSGLP